MTEHPLDNYLPEHDVRRRHDVVIERSPDDVWDALLRADLSRPALVRWLFKLRGMGWRGIPKPLTLRALERFRFAILDERPGRYVVLGIVGRFWTPGGHLRCIDRRLFLDGPPAGFASAASSFELEPLGEETTRLATETRVRAGDAASRRRFLAYWRIVGPLSALVRRAMLAEVAREATTGR